MKKILVRSPKGNVGLELADHDNYTAGDMIQIVARVFGYASILSGIDQGELRDETSVALNPKGNLPAGEYDLYLMAS